ncbi:CinA family protein [Ideonella sp.]|uniref:CinA family protein n=1 Tax=Ideonella sp. TaxID=1929293 RepID=UPI002B48A261|nr:CinA family protein [Ideonella sp.]HJV72200.1 CinA family protein [Ideonella sp.]
MPLLNDDDALMERVAVLADTLRGRGLRLATAESCTGGLFAALCTSVAGSSDWFERGFITYSNAAKTEALGVDAGLIAAHGAVSEPVARAMATGALAHSPADLALAVTGIAGPGGATPGKPVGLVWLALAAREAAGGPSCGAEHRVWPGDRTAVRSATVQWGLERLLALATGVARR